MTCFGYASNMTPGGGRDAADNGKENCFMVDTDMRWRMPSRWRCTPAFPIFKPRPRYRSQSVDGYEGALHEPSTQFTASENYPKHSLEVLQGP